jgi:hypothetical protein
MKRVHLLVFAFLVLGCSSHLTRSQAKQLLEQQAPYRENLSRNVMLQIGKIASDCYAQDFGLPQPYDGVEADDLYKGLSQAGFLTIKGTGPHAWDVSLTPVGQNGISGEPYAHKQNGRCDYWQVNLPLAILEGFTITGIQEEGTHAKADVVLSWKPTPVGTSLKKQKPLRLHDLSDIPDTDQEFHTYTTASFDKYDDGWRLAR